MVSHIIAVLRRSSLVKDLEVVELVEEESVQLLRIKAEIVDGSILHVREAFFPHTSKYSYHWQTAMEELLLRWANAPHHPEIPTHPDHKHEGEQISPSVRVSIEDVLTEIETVLKSKRLIR
jgi:translation elongation factor EF-Tu-like GTPase